MEREKDPPGENGPLDLLVVGGGISGLALAHEVVTRRGDWSVAVLEAEDRPGGPIRSERVAGCLCEWGPSGFLTDVPHTWNLVEALGLADRARVARAAARRRFLWVRGQLEEVPSSPLAFLRSGVLSPKGRLRLLTEPFVRRGEASDDESVHSFAARRIGAEATSVLVDAIVSGIHAADPARLSLAAAFPRIAEMERCHGSLARAMLARMLRHRKEGRRTSGELTSFDEGLEVLIDALAGSLGPRLRTRTSAVELRLAPAGFEVRAAVPGAEMQIAARRLVLATPSHVASRLLASALPALASILAEIPYAPIAVTSLIYDRQQIRHPLDGYGFLVPRNQGVRMLGCIWTGSIFPDHVPAGRVLLRAMVGGARDPEGAALPDGALVDLVHTELARILGIEGGPAQARLFRHPLGIPQYVPGHLARLARARSALETTPGLHLAGNAYGGVGINDCVREAGELARRITF